MLPDGFMMRLSTCNRKVPAHTTQHQVPQGPGAAGHRQRLRHMQRSSTARKISEYCWFIKDSVKTFMSMEETIDNLIFFIRLRILH